MSHVSLTAAMDFKYLTWSTVYWFLC